MQIKKFVYRGVYVMNVLFESANELRRIASDDQPQFELSNLISDIGSECATLARIDTGAAMHSITYSRAKGMTYFQVALLAPTVGGDQKITLPKMHYRINGEGELSYMQGLEEHFVAEIRLLEELLVTYVRGGRMQGELGLASGEAQLELEAAGARG